MIRWIVGNSLRFRFIVVAFGLGLTFFGAQRLLDIPIDVFPEFAPARVEVQTLCLGLSPAEVEDIRYAAQKCCSYRCRDDSCGFASPGA